MSAQEYYRNDYASRPLSPPTNAPHDTSGGFDRNNLTDVDEQTGGVPRRATTPDVDSDGFNTPPPPPPHERDPSPYSDTPGYGRTNQGAFDEEGNNPYGKNFNMVNQDSKEALVPGVQGRSGGYQDLGVYSYRFLHPALPSC